MYDGRIRAVYHSKLEIELNDLERDYTRNKIEHPVYSSKDVSDAVGSMIYNMHVDPIYANYDLLVSSVVDFDEKEDSLYNTGDAEKDKFLEWVSDGLLHVRK